MIYTVTFNPSIDYIVSLSANGAVFFPKNIILLQLAPIRKVVYFLICPLSTYGGAYHFANDLFLCLCNIFFTLQLISFY